MAFKMKKKGSQAKKASTYSIFFCCGAIYCISASAVPRPLCARSRLLRTDTNARLSGSQGSFAVEIGLTLSYKRLLGCAKREVSGVLLPEIRSMRGRIPF